MSHRENLGKQLTALCKSEDSISGVCRAVGINRQQFSRYLSGSAVPNNRNLEKIARYFRVSPSDLFREPEDSDAPPRSNADRFELTERLLDLIRHERPSSLCPGNYYATFAYPHDPNVVVRSVMVVRKESNLTFFRRLTGFAEPDQTWWSLYSGDHRGIVLDRRQLVHFVAINSCGNQEPSLMTASWTTSQWPLLMGHAAVLGPDGPILAPVVITPCGERTTLRKAIRKSRVYSVDDPEIESVVIDMLAEKGTAMAQMMRALDLSVQSLKSESRPAGKADERHDRRDAVLNHPAPQR